MAGPVSLETKTPSAPLLKGRGLGVPEKLPLRTRNPAARLGLAKGECRDVPGADLVMAPDAGAPGTYLPLSALESWSCQPAIQGGCGERVEGRGDKPMYLPAQLPLSPKYRGKKGNG